MSSRIGQWNSKDTRTRLRQVAEKRLRANALKSKLAATSAPSKRTTLASTTVVQSRGEEGLIGEGSEPEHTQIRTQTSRSIVMRRSRIKQQQEGKQHYFRAFHTLNLESKNSRLKKGMSLSVFLFQNLKRVITLQKK